jgi:glutamyl-tRNA reductase
VDSFSGLVVLEAKSIVHEAEILLCDEAGSFIGWRESLSAIPTINQLQERANMFRQEELKKCTRKLSQNNNFSDRELEAVERLSRSIVNKMLHGPISQLRRAESAEKKQAAVSELSSTIIVAVDTTATTITTAIVVVVLQ